MEGSYWLGNAPDHEKMADQGLHKGEAGQGGLSGKG